GSTKIWASHRVRFFVSLRHNGSANDSAIAGAIPDTWSGRLRIPCCRAPMWRLSARSTTQSYERHRVAKSSTEGSELESIQSTSFLMRRGMKFPRRLRSNEAELVSLHN